NARLGPHFRSFARVNATQVTGKSGESCAYKKSGTRERLLLLMTASGAKSKRPETPSDRGRHRTCLHDERRCDRKASTNWSFFGPRRWRGGFVRFTKPQ